jgi:hypothetical protein
MVLPLVAASAAPLPGPVERTPDRAPGSARRTSSVDMLRPGGLGDPRLLVRATARDVLTGADGDARVADTARLDAEVRYDGTRELVAVRSEPARPGTAGLVGRSVATGFRAAADAMLAPGDGGGVLALLLDDLPVALVIAGYAHALTKELPPGAGRFRPPAGLCSGWREGGTMVSALEAGGPMPLRPGPDAPAVSRADDPAAWHDTPVLPPLAMRRRRRIDVEPGAAGIRVDAMFRDTYADPDGRETVLHEYELRAVLDPAGLAVREIVAEPRVLPAPECPFAAESVLRLVGTPVDAVAEQVRRDLRGPSTCTHLNDLLRSLTGVPSLLALRGA